MIKDVYLNRYQTVIRNIKAKSNSFYDSYLDLIESMFKTILDQENIEYDTTRTISYVLRGNDIKNYFINIIGIDETFYLHLFDRIKKCNDHKHKKEKNLTLDSVLSFMLDYERLSNYFLNFFNEENNLHGSEYYLEIFGKDEKDNFSLKKQIAILKSEINSFSLSNEELKHIDDLENMTDKITSLEMQNDILKQEIMILQNAKVNSLENKLNEALSLLISLKDAIAESRVATSSIHRLICGKGFTKNELDKEREKIEHDK